MIIKRIVIKNYRGKNFDFEPDNVNMLLKENGYGKTSLCDAIRYGLTGLLTKDNVRSTVVRITFDTGLDIVRSRGKNTVCQIVKRNPDGTESAVKVTEEAFNKTISDALNVSVNDIKIASSSEVLMNMKPDGLLKFLLKYIPEQLDFETVMQYFTTRTPDIEMECASVFPPMPTEFGIEKLEETYKHFYNLRREKNVLLRDRESLYKNIKATPPVRDISIVMEELERMTHAEKEQYAVMKKQQEFEANKRKRAMQESQIAALKKKIEILGDPQKPDDKKREKMEADKTFAEKSRLDIFSWLTNVKSNIDLFERTLESLNTSICPISNHLTCTTDKTSIRADIEKKISENRQMKENLEKQLEELDKNIATIVANIKTFELTKRSYETLEKYKEQLKAYEDNLIPMPPEPEKNVSSDELLRKRKQLELEKRNFEDYQKKTALQIEIEALKKKIDAYSSIITALGDKGEVKKAIINYYLSMFAEVCNSRAEDFAPGYKIQFVSDNGIRIYVKTPSNQKYYTMDSLSNGESTMAALLLTDMISQLSGAKLMFIDNVEAMDKDNLLRLRSLLENDAFLDAYDHVFICGVNHESVERIFDGILASYL